MLGDFLSTASQDILGRILVVPSLPVEDHAERPGREAAQVVAAVRVRDVDLVVGPVGPLDVVRDELLDVRFVFDDQYRCHASRLPS